MKITYSEKVREVGEGLGHLQQAAAQMEEAIGPAAARVRAEWDRIEDEKGRTLYTLRYSDGEDSATASFAPDELIARAHMGYRLSRLWDDVLQVKSHRLFGRLGEANGSEN